MKKTILCTLTFLLLLFGTNSNAQNKIKDLYTANAKGNVFYPTGTFISGDTLYIGPGNTLVAISVKREGDSTSWTVLPLKPYKENKMNFIIEHSEILSNVKKDSSEKAIKERQRKAAAKEGTKFGG